MRDGILFLARSALYEAVRVYRVRRHAGDDTTEALRYTADHVARCLKDQYERGSPIAGVAWSDFGTPLLASYSRSGTNWIRYVVETISGRPTPGQTRVVDGDDYIMDRSHSAFAVLHFHSKVILLIRDYRECMIRHHDKEWSADDRVEAFLRSKDAGAAAELVHRKHQGV